MTRLDGRESAGYKGGRVLDWNTVALLMGGRVLDGNTVARLMRGRGLDWNTKARLDGREESAGRGVAEWYDGCAAGWERWTTKVVLLGGKWLRCWVVRQLR